MTDDFEYENYREQTPIGMLETRDAEPGCVPGFTVPPWEDPDEAEEFVVEDPALDEETRDDDTEDGDAEDDCLEDDGLEDDDAAGDPGLSGPGPDGRTEALINGGRRNSAPGRLAFVREHWQLAVIGATAFVVVMIIVAVTVSGGGGPNPAWPSSVTRMQAEIATACRNPDVAAEPTQVNFACGPSTRQVLWVFGLLTSGGNPGFVDQSTGRRGLEPITPQQGGDVAWSLNLHTPYDPSNPVDSIEVAARAINNIIGGATLTGASGQPSVQAGLESQAANCQRYTGSPALTRRSGYPAVCARPLTTNGKQALVSDVFGQWMTGAPAKTATDAGVLFADAGNPASAQAQAIMSSLPGSGL